eukprot:PhF_6_TR17336/c0_g1_i1/m.26549
MPPSRQRVSMYCSIRGTMPTSSLRDTPTAFCDRLHNIVTHSEIRCSRFDDTHHRYKFHFPHRECYKLSDKTLQQRQRRQDNLCSLSGQCRNSHVETYVWMSWMSYGCDWYSV